MEVQTLFLVCVITRVFSATIDVFELEQTEAPAFCHKLECPKYTVLQNYQTYELRHYEPSVWVATNLTVPIFTDEDRRQLFFTLFYYISGNNTKHIKIPMTAPVLETIKHGQGPDCDSTFTIHFMMPFELQSNPPQPTDPKVFIATLPSINVYVRSYGGYGNGTKIQEELQQLADDIGDSEKYVPNPYYSAGYDNPYQIFNRHNEVWLQATGK